METGDEKFKELLKKYQNGKASEEEIAWLEAWYMQYQNIEKQFPSQTEIEVTQPLVWAGIQQTIGTQIHKVKLWPRIAAVAAAVALIVLGVYFFNAPSSIVNRNSTIVNQNDIAPGKNGATITLANGKVIQLSDAKSGVVIGKNDLKYDDNTLVIQSDSEGSGSLGTRDDKGVENGKAQALTAATARGQTYQFTLPDGTKVWLNADSKLEFPSNFVNSKARFVKLSGEGYFEVAKDKAHPFIVTTDKQEVEVLGTHFNINAYKDESNIRTTLLEGSVRVDLTGSVSDKSFRTLVPGQQSTLSDGGVIRIEQVDTEGAVAWKNGLFMFDAETLESIMMKVGRWYNVEVSYENEKVGKQVFSGSVSRFAKVSSVLSKLEKTGPVKFKIEGKKIIVMTTK
ncbi:FecR family protein [Pedobacter frigoris]|uniref:DUF4974 domain-containing protein n=1 Tax=Pedobacter frigoris TaxID=2571272 RepID=A0A4U1CM89_9SPHI|nr:FecR domain-containing protein [Pedobacter frigoris]TKC08977.1 DUF4974 domain-containing protein [Pedobacter frigoris]